MTVRKPLTLTLIALAIRLQDWHLPRRCTIPADGEVGVTTHPDHMQSTVSRGDVLQVCRVARGMARWRPFRAADALPVKATSATKTREQVQQEFLNMSAAEKQQIQDLYGGAR